MEVAAKIVNPVMAIRRRPSESESGLHNTTETAQVAKVAVAN
jgi:hypothetical protein